ncbi:hypothetical protein DVA86_20890 [Streptomyces armeniacus]|uniref:Uncharacterized protein n=1 Tax=Streptomyces armeniacus TaxID=83291 RepID=A0A345XSX5_9ACTN|nr:hypothetical protein [Streptomyces armeniacus]AXK34741.1 hypothetical protein DVA86_20890 [Streptomyces armeniacus]
MGDIAKGVLGGAWTLVAGWMLPTALNLAVFFLAVAPDLRRVGPVARLWPGSDVDTALLLLVSAVLLGLVLNALQVPLYRVLEGYVLWPAPVYARGCARHRAAKQALEGRLELLRLERAGPEGRTEADAARAAALRADPRIARAARRDRTRTTAQRSLLQEELSRYPADDGQIVPTRLGNAIRRLEEYGHNRYRLDTQTLWNELTGTAPPQVRRQAETARTSVDFFVALLYGHAAVALVALAAVWRAGTPAQLPVTAAVLLALIPVWYRCAVTSTDEWAAAVRALVNTGRRPLADSLGLVLPQDLAREREMWMLVTRMSRRPYRDAAVDAFAPYRLDPADTQCPVRGPGSP